MTASTQLLSRTQSNPQNPSPATGRHQQPALMHQQSTTSLQEPFSSSSKGARALQASNSAVVPGAPIILPNLYTGTVQTKPQHTKVCVVAVLGQVDRCCITTTGGATPAMRQQLAMMRKLLSHQRAHEGVLLPSQTANARLLVAQSFHRHSSCSCCSLVYMCCTRVCQTCVSPKP